MRNDKKEKAKQHYIFMGYQYKNEINFSVKNSKIYIKNNIFNKNKNNNYNTSFEILDIGTSDALNNISDGKIGLLNFASFKNPGGGFLKGSLAQEEALCHDSILYNVLEKFSDFYDYNNKHSNRGMYLDRAIYSPNIYFSTQDKFANVITCAAPNYKAGKKNNISKEQNTKYLRSRINFILNIAEDNNIDCLILGAFGCGVFEQDPNEVASIFLQECSNRNFKKIIFAIPDKNSYNYKCFNSFIENL